MSQYNNYKNKNTPILYIFAVAPHTGAWIEIFSYPLLIIMSLIVTPFTGAWIEIGLK